MSSIFIPSSLTDLDGDLPESRITNLVGDLAGKAPLASPALTGTPTAPTATAGTSTIQLATTAFVTGGLALKAPLASPTFTGTVTLPVTAGSVLFAGVSGALSQDNGNLFWDAVNKRMGFGTPTPARQLHVESTDNQYLRMRSGANKDSALEHYDGTTFIYVGMLGETVGPGAWGVYLNAGIRLTVIQDGTVTVYTALKLPTSADISIPNGGIAWSSTTANTLKARTPAGVIQTPAMLSGATFTGSVAFNGGTPSKPTISGSRGGNAALASLLTALAALGLITDSSTA